MRKLKLPSPATLTGVWQSYDKWSLVTRAAEAGGVTAADVAAESVRDIA